MDLTTTIKLELESLSLLNNDPDLIESYSFSSPESQLTLPTEKKEKQDANNTNIDDDLPKIGWRLRPRSAKQLAAVLAELTASKKPVASSELDALHQDNPVWLDVSRLNHVIGYQPDDLTITCQTGMTLQELNTIIGSDNLCLPLTYPDDTTLFEIIGDDMPAPETGFGGGYPRDFILGMQVATTDGVLSRCGGKVMKNVTGYDLNKLYTGSHHYLGICTEVTLKLSHQSPYRGTWLFDLDDAEAGLSAWRTLNASALASNLCQCDIFYVPTNNQWQLAVGLQSSMTEPRKLGTELKKILSDLTGRKIPATRDKTLLHHFATHWEAPLVIEVATTKGQLSECVKTINLLWGNDVIYRVCPQSALIYLMWDTHKSRVIGSKVTPLPQSVSLHSSLESLYAVLNKSTPHHQTTASQPTPSGFLKINRYPDTYIDLAKHWNTPADKVVRQLHQRIKQLYDPDHTLYSSSFPHT